ncbi:hypothetical protein Tco_1345142 [Tanacetum coccineum]
MWMNKKARTEEMEEMEIERMEKTEMEIEMGIMELKALKLLDPVNTSLHTIDHETRTRKEKGDSLNLPDHRIHKDGDGDASFQLKSDSLPHAHAQSTKTFNKHQDSKKKS